MKTSKIIFLAIILFCFYPWVLLADQSRYPLEPPDNSSPRATLQTFLDTMNKALETYRMGERDEAGALARRASLSLDLESKPQAIKNTLSVESVIYLKEILDRIELPPWEKIPDQVEIQKSNLTSWTIPHTEITIASKKIDGQGQQFLFTRETVDSLEYFFDKVKSLPYRSDSGGGALANELITSSNYEIVNKIIGILPNWTRMVVFGQMLWQWLGLAVLVHFMILAVVLGHRLSRGLLVLVDSRFNSNFEKSVGRFVIPILLIVLSIEGLSFLWKGLHIINSDIYFPVAISFTVMGYIGAIWFLGCVLNRIANTVIKAGGFITGNVDAQIIRIGFDLITAGIILAAIVHLGSRIGLPTYSLVGGLGISGIAIALAGREALSNLIGTVVILLDHPFKVDDFVILGEKTQGTVMEIGLRSTRILTLDGLLVSVPNATLANMEIINQSAPSSETRITITVGVAYGSVVSEVEKTLLEIARSSQYAALNLDPVVRFDSFGDSSLNFALLIWIKRPELKKIAVSEINYSIYEEFQKKGIEIPFPQRDVHVFSEN